MKKGFHNEPVYDDKYIKTKRKLHNGETNTYFHGNDVTNEGAHCVSLSVIVIDSIVQMGKNSYPQVCLEKYKYIVWENKLNKFFNDELNLDSSDESDYSDDSNKENS